VLAEDVAEGLVFAAVRRKTPFGDSARRGGNVAAMVRWDTIRLRLIT
jgi:hypothetical protein